MSRPSTLGVIYAFTTALLLVPAPGQATDKVSPVYVVDLGEPSDNTETRFAIAFNLKVTANAGTARAYVLTSHDGKKWQIAATSSTITQNGAEVYEIEEPAYLCRYIAVLVDTNAATWIGSVDLLTNTPIKLISGASIAGLVTPTLDLGTIPAAAPAVSKQGRATVVAGQTTVAVTFAQPMVNTNYSVAFAPSAGVGVWYTAKGITGFTVNISAAQGADMTVDWRAIADS